MNTRQNEQKKNYDKFPTKTIFMYTPGQSNQANVSLPETKTNKNTHRHTRIYSRKSRIELYLWDFAHIHTHVVSTKECNAME